MDIVHYNIQLWKKIGRAWWRWRRVHYTLHQLDSRLATVSTVVQRVNLGCWRRQLDNESTSVCWTLVHLHNISVGRHHSHTSAAAAAATVGAAVWVVFNISMDTSLTSHQSTTRTCLCVEVVLVVLTPTEKLMSTYPHLTNYKLYLPWSQTSSMNWTSCSELKVCYVEFPI